jgi:hypothetical protein
MQLQNQNQQVSAYPKNELTEVVLTSGLSAETTELLLTKFQPFIEQYAEIKEKAVGLVVTDSSQKELMNDARVARLALQKIRVAADKAREGLKKDALAYGNAVQKAFNTIASLIKPIEDHLQVQEDFKKREEAERKAKLKIDRELLLQPFCDTKYLNLADMSEEEFQVYFLNMKSAHEARLAAEAKAEQDRIDAEQLAAAAEAQRIADEAARIEAQRIENEKLKAEREEQERLLAAERAAAAAERAAAEQKLLEAQRIIEAERKAVEAAAAAEAQRIAEAERKAAAAEAQRLAELEAAAAAPDKEKLLQLAILFQSIEIPTLSTKKAAQIAKNIADLQSKLVNFITEKANTL